MNPSRAAPQGSDLDRLLDDLERCITERPGAIVEHPATTAQLLNEHAVPAHPTHGQLARLLPLLYRLRLRERPANTYARQAFYAAERWLHQLLYDPSADARRYQANFLDALLARGGTPVEFARRYIRDDLPPGLTREAALQAIAAHYDYPPVVKLPWSEEEAAAQLQPYFTYLERDLVAEPTSYLQLSWRVLDAGNSVSRRAFGQWIDTLSDRGLAEPHALNNLGQALSLHRSLQAGFCAERADFEEWLAWFRHPSTVLRGVAARAVGDTFADGRIPEDGYSGFAAYGLPEMLALVYSAQVDGQRVAGGFVNGITDGGGLRELARHPALVAADFDLHAWVMRTVLDSPEHEPYVPGAQAFWFYVHEYLDRDPESVMRLIDGGRYWVAHMCATESLDERGWVLMMPVLERLAAEAPAQLARAAREVLARAPTGGSNLE